MQLKDIEPKTELMLKALIDGIETIDDYNIWLTGYVTAYRECKAQVKGYFEGIDND